MGHNCYCFLWGVLFWLLRWLWDASRLNISSKLLDQVSSVAPVIVSVGKRSIAKNKCPESFLSVVKKIFEKLVNNKMLDHLEVCCLFSDFQYGLLTLNEPRISESCIVIKIKFLFHASLWCLKGFMKAEVAYEYQYAQKIIFHVSSYYCYIPLLHHKGTKAWWCRKKYINELTRPS